jgi:deazaflavin-dependent oxidoreductase (nitroreductase family)
MEGTLLERLLLVGNRLVEPLVKAGIPMGSRRAPMALLTVPGRKSGQPRTVPVALAPNHDGWILISVYGVSDWSKNLEAAGAAVVTMRGESIDVTADRLSPQKAAPILRAAISDAPRMVSRITAKYYRAAPGSPLKEWEQEATAHPVFQLSPSQQPAATADHPEPDTGSGQLHQYRRQ